VRAWPETLRPAIGRLDQDFHVISVGHGGHEPSADAGLEIATTRRPGSSLPQSSNWRLSGPGGSFEPGCAA
jgi:hypothetical protein